MDIFDLAGGAEAVRDVDVVLSFEAIGDKLRERRKVLEEKGAANEGCGVAEGRTPWMDSFGGSSARWCGILIVGELKNLSIVEDFDTIKEVALLVFLRSPILAGRTCRDGSGLLSVRACEGSTLRAGAPIQREFIN